MAKLDFHERWIGWIMMCVESVAYTVQVNQDHVGLVFPSRGLRQGDPFHVIFIFYVPRVCQLLFMTLKIKVICMVLQCVEVLW